MPKLDGSSMVDPVIMINETQDVHNWIYPIDMALFLSIEQTNSHASDVAYPTDGQMDSPILVTRYALACWNSYVAANDDRQLAMFLEQARWLVAHEQTIAGEGSCWPVSLPDVYECTAKHCLSALVQGQAISVLMRAFMLRGESVFLECARRALRCFQRDILDGGVCAPMPGNGIYFEEYAVYPASHTLEGMVFALLGLGDFLKLQDDTSLASLFEQAHGSLHNILCEFDTGYWLRTDLLHRHLASKYQHKQQVYLLRKLAQATCCQVCMAESSRWEQYGQHFIARLHAGLNRNASSLVRACWHPLQRILFKQRRYAQASPGKYALPSQDQPLHVCVPITAFPMAGGMRAVIASHASATRDIWSMEYLTPYVGQNPEHLPIHRVGAPARAPWLISPWQFPTVWLYTVAGTRKLISLLRQNRDYKLILPQDGVYTAAFSALVARLAGIRVVCMDYGNLTLLHSSTYKNERRKELAAKSRFYRIVGPMLLKGYWLSLALFTWVSTRLVDHFLISGMEGDGIEETYCGKLGVPRSRITRYAYTIDLEQYPGLDAQEKVRKRLQCGIPADAHLISMICRFAPEKGIDIALKSIRLALAALQPEQRKHLLFVLAGNGPLKEQIEEEIDALDLRDVCRLWGEASPEDVATLLSISDIFLHTSTRGAYYSMTVLEAMASGCAIIASDQPPLNAQLLADGRGIVVPAGDVEQTARALVSLWDIPPGHQMGADARRYIQRSHSPTSLRRVLQRATYWSKCDSFLDTRNISESDLEEN